MSLFFAIKPSSLAATSAASGRRRWIDDRGERKKKEMEMKAERKKESGRAPYKNAISAGGTCANYSLSLLLSLSLFLSLSYLVLFFPFRPYPPWTARSILTSTVAPTANGEIMIKPTSFQWNDGNYRVGCSRLPVFVHYSEATYKYLSRSGGKWEADELIVHIFPSSRTIRGRLYYHQFSRGRGG